MFREWGRALAYIGKGRVFLEGPWFTMEPSNSAVAYKSLHSLESLISPPALSPLLTPGQLHCSPCCSLDTPGLLLPQCLCICHSFCLKRSFPGYPGGPLAHLLSVLLPQSKAFVTILFEIAPPSSPWYTTTPCPALLFSKILINTDLLVQCFLNQRTYQNHLEGLLKQSAGPHPQVLESVAGWGLRMCVSSKFSGGADAAGWRTHSENQYTT